MRLLILVLCLLCAAPAWATTYYVDDNGSDANNGLSEAAPWKTWTKAFGASGVGGGNPCGHTLIVMDGTYTPSVHGDPLISGKTCTAGSVFTVQAQNSRAAHISGTGAAASFKVLNSAYIVIDGLHVSAADLAPKTGTIYHNVEIFTSTHITFKNGLVHTNNRYRNTHLIGLHNTTDSLIEDTELYNFHRHGVFLYYSNANTVRRLYCHGRNRADLTPAGTGFDSLNTFTGEECVAVYPGNDNIIENVLAENTSKVSSVESSGSGLGRNNQFFGLIGLGTRPPSGTAGGSWYGATLAARGNTSDFQPQNNTYRHVVYINPGTGTSGGVCMYLRAAFNTQVFNMSCFNPLNSGFVADDYQPGGFTGGGVYSAYCYNCLVVSGESYGFNIESSIQTWSMDNVNSFGNVTAYTPASHANYNNPDTPQSIDPQMGDCYLWAPDGSAADTNNWGAEILYRYQNGVLQDGTGGTTKTRLWGPEWPYGALVTGVNDVVGQSAFDVHKRLNVPYSGDTHTCNFPASYAPNPPVVPANPANYVSSTGTNSTSHSHTLAGGGATDIALVAVALRDNGFTVGSVSSVTGCASEAYTFLDRQVSGTVAVRALEWYYKLAPTTGACTITVNTTGAVTAMITTSIALDDVSAIGASAFASGGLVTTSTVTVPTNANEKIVSAFTAGDDPTLTAIGANQTLQTDKGHASTSHRLAISEQSGANGGSTSYTISQTNYSAIGAVSLCPTAGCTGASPAVLSQVAGQVLNAFLVNGAVQTLGAVNAANVDIPRGTSFAVALQTDATVANPAAGGRSLYVSRNSGAYVAVTDTAVNGLSFHGTTSDPLVISGAVSANLSGGLTNVPGTTIHSVTVNPQSDMTQDSSLVNRWVLKLEPTATATDTFEFREYTDAGVALNAYGATADAKITVTAGATTIQAPTAMRVAGASTNTTFMLTWAPVSFTNLAGYRVYESTTSGVYGDPIREITPAYAALHHSPLTQYVVTKRTGGTYYYIVKAFDNDNNESPASSEITVVVTGMEAR